MIEVKEKYTEKELLYLKGFLQGKKYSAGIRALNIAVTQHGDQMRKSGDLYISHPIRIANALISLGIENENVIVLALLHDVLEDTRMTREEVRCIFGEYIEKQLLLLSKRKGYNNDDYYGAISESADASIVKIADRCHNVSTMYFFTEEKINEYIKETEEYSIPLCSMVADRFPEYADYIYYMKYHIESILETTKFFIKKDK